MNFLKNLFENIIQIQTKTLQKLDKKISYDPDGNLPQTAALAYCKQQSKSVTGSVIEFKNNISIYMLNVTASTELTFKYSNLNRSTESYVFQLWINMSGNYTIEFPSDVVWINDEAPDMSEVGLYCIAFRILPTEFVNSTITSPSIIGSLNYSHAVIIS